MKVIPYQADVETKWFLNRITFDRILMFLSRFQKLLIDLNSSFRVAPVELVPHFALVRFVYQFSHAVLLEAFVDVWY